MHELQTSRLIPQDSEELLILRLAKIFGETEVAVPKAFIAKVREYIKKWQSSNRLENTIRRLWENNYAPTIRAALASQELPPQFMYVALQETNFQPRAVGPMSNRILRLYGPAKGMWQFIPPTAEKFGLKIGPLRHTRRYDPADERHDFRKASYAAARYKPPLVGPVMHQAAVARFARTLSTTVAAGVPLVEALESVARATGNLVYSRAAMQIHHEGICPQTSTRVPRTNAENGRRVADR